MIIACMMCLCACGDDSKTEDIGSSSVISQDKLAEIIVKDDVHADFVFYGDGSGELNEITSLNISFGKYVAGLDDFDRIHKYQCSIWLDEGNDHFTLFEDGKADYLIEPEKITISADMSAVSDFSFADIGGDCNIYYAFGDEGGPNLTFAWPDVVNMSGYTPGRQSEEVEEVPNEEPQTDEGDSAYWFMDIELSSHGGNWNASKIVLSAPDDRGLPTIVTVSESGYDVMGNPLDGVYNIVIDEYDIYDDMTYLVGRYNNESGAGIKGEFYDGDDKVLTLEID